LTATEAPEAPIFDLDRIPEREKFVSEPSDIAYVSGSRLAGLGNARSDLDLFVVYEDAARAKAAPRMFILDEFRVDMERYSLEAMHALARRINEVDVDDPAAVGALAHDNIDLYYRTSIGAAVHNAAGFADLVRAFESRRATEVYRAWSIARAATLLAEARALLGTPKRERAYLRARRALSAAVEAVGAAHGYGYPSTKWCFVKLADIYGHDAAEFRTPWSLKALGTRSLDDYVAAVEAYAADAGVPVLRAQGVEQARLRHDPEARLFDVGPRHFLIQRKVRAFELNDTGARTWDLIDGTRTVAQVVDELLADGFPNRMAATYHVQRFVTAMRDDGLLVGDLYAVAMEGGLDESR
jgi:hypothetical protein